MSQADELGVFATILGGCLRLIRYGGADYVVRTKFESGSEREFDRVDFSDVRVIGVWGRGCCIWATVVCPPRGLELQRRCADSEHGDLSHSLQSDEISVRLLDRVDHRMREQESFEVVAAGTASGRTRLRVFDGASWQPAAEVPNETAGGFFFGPHGVFLNVRDRVHGSLSITHVDVASSTTTDLLNLSPFSNDRGLGGSGGYLLCASSAMRGTGLFVLDVGSLRARRIEAAEFRRDQTMAIRGANPAGVVGTQQNGTTLDLFEIDLADAEIRTLESLPNAAAVGGVAHHDGDYWSVITRPWQAPQFQKVDGTRARRATPRGVRNVQCADGCEVFEMRSRRRSRGTFLFLHGGPVEQFGSSVHWACQLAVSLDLDLLAPNFFGSVGYGVEFSEHVFGSAGEADVRQVVESLNELAPSDRPLIIGGESYGAWLLQRVLQQLARPVLATISVSGLIDFAPSDTLLPKRTVDFMTALIGTEPRPERSNLSTAPANALFVHGVADPRIPVEYFRQSVSRLATTGAWSDTRIEVLELPGEHSLGRDRRLVSAVEKFLHQTLQPKVPSSCPGIAGVNEIAP